NRRQGRLPPLQPPLLGGAWPRVSFHPEGRLEVEEARMRIGELAERLGVNPKTIRYYESIGLLSPPERTPAGYRIYGEDALERLTFIKTAQRLGITLDETREILALRDRG